MSTQTTQYTPGPWRVSRQTFGGRDVGANIMVNSLNGLVAVACTIHEGAVNAEANAHLIAAAPDLLAACVFTLKELTDNARAEYVDFEAIRARLEAAISKTKGKA